MGWATSRYTGNTWHLLVLSRRAQPSMDQKLSGKTVVCTCIYRSYPRSLSSMHDNRFHCICILLATLSIQRWDVVHKFYTHISHLHKWISMKSWCFRDKEEIGKYICSYCLLNHRKEKLVKEETLSDFPGSPSGPGSQYCSLRHTLWTRNTPCTS